MSMTPTMRRTLWFGAVFALAGALTLTPGITVSSRASAVATRPFGVRPAAPAPSTNNDPVVRIAALNAKVATRDAARVEVQARRDGLVRRLAETRLAESAALARSDLLGQQAAAAKTRYEVARAEVGQLAAAFYRNAGSPGVMVELFRSRSAAEFGYRQKIVSEVGVLQARVVQRALRARRTAVRTAREAGDEQVRLHALIETLVDQIPSLDTEIERLQAGLSRARYWLARWQSIAGGVNTPIMSRSILGPSELATWFSGTRRRARITVSMEELARAFIEEGQAASVRGDLAFAQSILETGSFFFPDGGQLTPTDNNFAGINACDSCPTGSSFPDARTGVRAQMQLLRVYADANLTNAALNPPAVDPRLDTHFLKGQVTTWNGLTHTWATADQYGDRIVGIYTQILGWLMDHDDV